MADLALELSDVALRRPSDPREAPARRGAAPSPKWWTRQHSERRRPTGAVWAARHRGVDALATALSDASELRAARFDLVRGKYEVSEEGAALTTLLSDDARHHKSFCRSTNEATAHALDGLRKLRRSYDATERPHATGTEPRGAVPRQRPASRRAALSTNARLAWLHAAMPLCIRTDENEWPLTCAARHAVGRLRPDASCSIKGSPLPRWWDADDAAVRGSKNRDRFARTGARCGPMC